MMIVAAWLLSTAPMAAGPVPGLYVADQIEVAAGLELLENGRFRYALDYGAVSEGAEGKWTSDGHIVRLTSDTAPNDGERSAAAFHAQPLRRHGDLLLLERYETVIRFERARPERE